MKISTKIVAGYAILIVLFAGLVAVQIHTIHRLQLIVEMQANANQTAATTAVNLIRYGELVEEFAGKSLALPRDAEYRGKLQEYRTDFESNLRLTMSSSRTDKEKEAIARLASVWTAFSEELERQLVAVQTEPAPDTPAAIRDHLEELKIQAEVVRRAFVDEISAEVAAARKSARDSRTLTWILTAAALGLIVLVSLLIVQSISSPLKQLTHGTRAIAEGKFFYRLDTTRHDEFAQLARDFNTMTQRLNELDQMKRDFVSHVSHELKAPLASMQETIQLLLEQIPGPLSEKQRRLLELNLASGLRLSAMIGNLLDLSRMEAGVMQYELKNNDLSALARNAVVEFQPQAANRDISLIIEAPSDPVMIECDGDRILQVVRNLLGNAIKFSPKGQQIRIRLATTAGIPAGLPDARRATILVPPDGREFALLTVADAGPGVPDQHKERIFEKFHQVKQGKKLPGQGAGLGLAISHTIAEAHHGAIWVENNPGGGSIFNLLLPPGETGNEVQYRASSPI